MDALGSLAREVIEDIRRQEPEGFLGAAEIARGCQHGLEINIIEPYLSRMRQEMPSASDLDTIQQELRTLILQMSPRAPGSAFYALGKFCDPQNIPFMREQLVLHLKELLRANHPVSALVFALNDNGENLIGGTSHSLMDIDKSIADARRYLSGFGHVIPW